MKKLRDMTPAERQQRVSLLARQPGTRSKIPTKYLKGFAGADKLRQQRAMNTRLDTPFVPGSTATNRDVAREREAATTLKYQPTEADLQRQVGASEDRERRELPGWYADYQRILRESEDASHRNAELAVGQVGQLQQGVGQIARGEQAKVNEQMQASAAQRGATYNQAAQDDEAQRAINARAALTQNFGAQLAGLGQLAAQRFTDERPIAMQRLGGEQATERGRRRNLTDKQADLLREKGAFRDQYMADRRDQEGKAALERAVFGAETADKAADNARQVQQDRSQRYDKIQQRSLARQREQRQAEADERAAEKDRYQREHGTGPYKTGSSETPEQHRRRKQDAEKLRTQITTARDMASSMLKTPVEDPPKSGHWRKPTEQEVRTVLLKRFKDSTVVNAAMELRKRNRLNPGTAKRITRRGAGVPKEWQETKVAPPTIEAVRKAARKIRIG